MTTIGDDIMQGTSYTVVTTDLGVLGVGATPRGVCRAFLCDDEATASAMLESEFGAGIDGTQDVDAWAMAMVEHVAGDTDAVRRVPVDMHGTDFQLEVWSALRAIPRGETATCTEVAIAIGKPGSVRAVAGACAANRIAVVIPCHRVIRKDGTLADYRWGTQRKRTLLARERGCRSDMPQLTLTTQPSLPF